MSIEQKDLVLFKLREIRSLVVGKEFTHAEILCNEFLQQEPNNTLALQMLGVAYASQSRYQDAALTFMRCVDQNPGDISVLGNLATCFLEGRKHKDAVLVAKRMILLDPKYYRPYLILAIVAMSMGRVSDAKKYIESAKKCDSAVDAMLDKYTLMLIKMHCCDWSSRGQDIDDVVLALASGGSAIYCFDLLALIDDPALHRKAAEREVQRYRVLSNSVKNSRCEERIRVCYVSAEFHRHATMQLMEGIFREHDKARFYMIGVSIAANKINDEVRLRVEQYFDGFYEVDGLSDEELSVFLCELDIDVLIDLKGFTFGNRIAAIASKPAHVVINFLGYPGTSGSEKFDYIIGDRIVTPIEDAGYYSEKIIQMPHSYQPNDVLPIIDETEIALVCDEIPSGAFVFAAFNAPYKISPQVFDIWMKLLANIPGSVLWFVCEDLVVIENLRREAVIRGVADSRLIFSKKVSQSLHFQRHKLADVFLDTFPYGAHTTASDALRCGVPLVTCIGRSFASRVASSLLNAVGLTELIANDMEEYFAKALNLSQHPEVLFSLRARLISKVRDSPLFNPSMFARSLEIIYKSVTHRSRKGSPPVAFHLSPSGDISYF